MMSRMLAALVRRAESGDLFVLGELAELVAKSRGALARGALAAHEGPAGYSWREIGQELGISRQAAQQLYGRDAASEPPGKRPGEPDYNIRP